MRALRLLGVLAVLPLLAGCTNLADVAGVVGALAAGSSSANPVAAFAVGVSVRAGAREALMYYGRRRQQGEQDALAEVAGNLDVGSVRPWKIEHTIPYGNEHGELRVVRVIDTPIARCKQIIYSVAELQDHLFTAEICRQEKGWKWATAEPAVDRWGTLQ
ncbi:MAG: hypothetical protein JO212_10555 [Acetobacteraceae bacterium]|nr:hypothetical protein [Acetobacteraceae bacterium]